MSAVGIVAVVEGDRQRPGVGWRGAIAIGGAIRSVSSLRAVMPRRDRTRWWTNL
jgi:hypothetical protein